MSTQPIGCFSEVHLASSQGSLSPSLPCSGSYSAGISGAKTSMPLHTRGLNILPGCTFPDGREAESFRD